MVKLNSVWANLPLVLVFLGAVFFVPGLPTWARWYFGMVSLAFLGALLFADHIAHRNKRK